MKALIITTFFFLTGVANHAQNALFLTQGRIEYEKRINLYAQLDDIHDQAWRDLMKKTTPQFKTTYFDIHFAWPVIWQYCSFDEDPGNR